MKSDLQSFEIFLIVDVSIYDDYHFQVVIEGVTGKGWRGDIALDDISIDNTPCPPPGMFQSYS